MDIFACKIKESHLDVDNDKLYKLISNLYSQHAGRSESNKGGWQSENIISELPSFVDKIKPVVKEYMDEIKLNIELDITQVWANINKYKDYNAQHFHLQSNFTGVYFVKGEKQTGNLLLHNPFTNFNYCWFNGKLVKIITPNQYNSQVVKIYPQPGKLIVYPSWLQHSVEPNLTNEERVSISFDIN